MNIPVSTFDIIKEALPDLLLKIQQGKVQLPNLQSSFCWRNNLILLDPNSPSREWTMADWVGKANLEPLCPTRRS